MQVLNEIMVAADVQTTKVKGAGTVTAGTDGNGVSIRVDPKSDTHGVTARNPVGVSDDFMVRLYDGKVTVNVGGLEGSLTSKQLESAGVDVKALTRLGHKLEKANLTAPEMKTLADIALHATAYAISHPQEVKLRLPG